MTAKALDAVNRAAAPIRAQHNFVVFMSFTVFPLFSVCLRFILARRQSHNQSFKHSVGLLSLCLFIYNGEILSITLKRVLLMHVLKTIAFWDIFILFWDTDSSGQNR
jgi:hypothetical protein